MKISQSLSLFAITLMLAGCYSKVTVDVYKPAESSTTSQKVAIVCKDGTTFSQGTRQSCDNFGGVQSFTERYSAD